MAYEKNLTTLEKIIYLADGIEPTRSHPGVDELRELATQDLDAALMLSMQRTIDYVLQQGYELSEETVAALDWLRRNKT